MDCFLMDVPGNLWIVFCWMLPDIYGFFHGCCWNFMVFYLLDVAGSLWIVSCMLLEIYGFLFN